MKARRASLLLIFGLILLWHFSPPALLEAQTPTPIPRDTAIDQIKQFAAVHVSNNQPPQTQLVVDLFRDRVAGLSPLEIAQIYIQEYQRLKQAADNPLNRVLLFLADPVTLIPLIFGILLGLIGTMLKQGIERTLKAVGNFIADHTTGSPLLHGLALKRYYCKLAEEHKTLVIPFRQGPPLETNRVYVPLRILGSTDGRQVDSHIAIRSHNHLVIVGPPGAGKSMLLKHIALAYAEAYSPLRHLPVTILLALHRMNDPSLSLQQQLREELERNNFPNGDRFVARALANGGLTLLLDGLDEVGGDHRDRVAREINDLLHTHSRCRVIVTCRSAVYNDEFAGKVDQTMEIIEFSDQQIRQFLRSWEKEFLRSSEKDMPPDKSVEHLMRTLHDRPQIMALARNPLLLTMIAYLYTDPAFVLPHSRAEFYRQSTDLLLRQWHHKQNRVDPGDKRLVLQHLALFFYDNKEEERSDRRSASRNVVLQQIQGLTPRLNLASHINVHMILGEIVERSGLLLAIDGGERYQFAHLTLQEFFAAGELSRKPDELIDRFQADPDTWREPVKLWCGLADESTTMIQSVYKRDAITGFECLADARVVDPALANVIIERFKARLGQEEKFEVINQAFGAVASDPRPRGRAVFSFLCEKLDESTPSPRRTAAANALSLTNLPQAAREFGQRYANRADVRSPLAKMGDLAVPVLLSLAKEDKLNAFQDLCTIGTVPAAEALATLLWHKQLTVSVSAAWHLATLLLSDSVEEGLASYDYTQIDEQGEVRRSSDWVWKPFNKPVNSALPVITGRIVQVIGTAPSAMPPTTIKRLDPRLAIALWIDGTERKKSKQYLSAIEGLVSSDIRARLDAEPPPSRNHWLNMFGPVGFEFKRSWLLGAVIVGGGILLGQMVAVALLTTTLYSVPVTPSPTVSSATTTSSPTIINATSTSPTQTSRPVP